LAARIGTDLEHAASLLRAGDPVVIPTGTVHGLAANAFNQAAVV
jgi:L-threonylcarbamoyladenylate synthase